MRFHGILSAGFALLVLSTRLFAVEADLVLQQSRRYFGTQDATLHGRGDLERFNLGGMESLITSDDGNIALIRFDVSPIPNSLQIVGATLELYLNGAKRVPEVIAPEHTVDILPVRYPWWEGTGYDRPMGRRLDGVSLATWDGRLPWPGGGIEANLDRRVASIPLPKKPGHWCVWRLPPDLVRAWLEVPDRNYGLAIRSTSPMGSQIYASREHQDLARRPKLRLCVIGDDSTVNALARRFNERHTPIASVAASAVPSQPQPETEPPEVKLAIIHLGRKVAIDHPVARDFGWHLSRIQAKFPDESRESIAAIVHKVWTEATKEGIPTSLPELAYAMATVVPDGEKSTFKLSDTAASLLAILIATKGSETR